MKKIFVNGCFDILHRGHIELFRYAKSLGAYLLVGIDSDYRVKQLKGEFRPINGEKDRKFMLESIRHIDEVVIFNTSTDLENVVKKYSPDVMVLGSDYRDKTIIGSEYAKELKFFERIDEYSTSRTIKNISNR